MSKAPQTVQRCRWAEPTLYQPNPQWLEAWDYPWSCRRTGGAIRLIEDTTVCETCNRWKERAGAAPETGDWGQV
jgi:hypothetical protein